MVLSRPIPTYFFIFVTFAFFTLNFKNPSQVSSRKLWEYQNSITNIPKLSSFNLLNPFRQATHYPAIPENRTNEATSWYSTWNWLSPFSFPVNSDENRSLLPPPRDRRPIYTYFDHSLDKDQADLKEAENAILLTWRRAWWAQGFQPIILSSAEAINNPLSIELQMKDIDLTLKDQILRWLAWENAGTGILCDYRLLPMGAYDDPLLVFLRRGNYPRLTRFENLGSGLFAGSKTDITAALRQVFANKDLENSKDFISVVVPDTFLVEPEHLALAYYDNKTISDKYSRISNQIIGQGAKGLTILNQLIVSHLHSTWQNIFQNGIAVLKPLPKHMTVLTEPAFHLATILSDCSESPLPSSCPPNLPKCKPCVASQPLRISTPSTFSNTSSVYTIGTVPHPYTNALLSSGQDIDIAWVRRVSERDVWISTVTKDTLGTGISGPARVIKFKETVASDYGTACSIWFTPEYGLPKDLDWYFGFTISSHLNSDGKSETPVPGPERRPKKESDPRNGPVATKYDLDRERETMKKVKRWGEEKLSEEQDVILRAIEAWNLADFEAWRFTRALSTRITFDRLSWEEREKKHINSYQAKR